MGLWSRILKLGSQIIGHLQFRIWDVKLQVQDLKFRSQSLGSRALALGLLEGVQDPNEHITCNTESGVLHGLRFGI